MTCAATGLQVSYPDFMHVKCAAHSLHRICGAIRSKYPQTNKIISSVKNFFVKVASIREIFKNSFPNLALPAEPKITRRGTWL